MPKSTGNHLPVLLLAILPKKERKSHFMQINTLSATRTRLITITATIISCGIIAYIMRGKEDFIRYLIDTDVYRLGAIEFLGEGELYNKDYATRLINLPFTYPPFGALFFIPFAFLGQVGAETLLTVVSALCLWLSMGAILRTADIKKPWLWALWCLPVALVFEPVHETFQFGQINLILMTLVIIDITGLIPKLPRGILIGVAAAIKLTPAYFGLYFLARAQWKGALGVIGGFLGASALAFICHPATSIQYFTSVVFHANRIGNPEYAKNVSISGINARTVDSQLVWLIVCVAITALAFFAARRATVAQKPLLAIIAIALACLCVSPVSWSHHWVWLVPTVIVLFIYNYRGLAIWGVLAAIVFPFHYYLPQTGGVESEWALWQQVLGAHYVIFALVILCITLRLPKVATAH
ncbi:DUF2029 domain-containing protein [Corynebacterium sp. sy017]|nr:DUF2029 domain-containing protein [Corynebacterium sp. sy017]TSD92506.1 DUF2029 domain-containing protein [Corynebacterium sp. SY003]